MGLLGDYASDSEGDEEEGKKGGPTAGSAGTSEAQARGTGGTSASGGPTSAAAASSTSASAAAAGAGEDQEEDSDEESEEEESVAKRPRVGALGFTQGLPSTRKKAGAKSKGPSAAVTQFLPAQVRKQGRVVSVAIDNISDQAFEKNKG
mmetsp:Transcript_56111/g.161051  ORF Transcript_56111/g.161051 Transcript_56111/m.161051 type:complete len:149 (+) Transcript_56111:75-521(+)